MSEPTMFERRVRGEVTVEEYVAHIERRVEQQRREYKRGRGPKATGPTGTEGPHKQDQS